MDLRNIDLFREFTQEELEPFFAIIRELNLSAGQILFEENDPGDALYVIETGAVRIFKRIDRALGTEKSLALLDAGAYLGEMTLMDGTPRSASARAEVPSRILKLSREDFSGILCAYPQAAMRLFTSFMKVMAQRLRQTNEELVALYEVGKIIAAAPTLEELLRGVLARAMAGTGAALGAVFFLNDITNKLEARESAGEGSVNLLGLKTPTGQGVVGAAIAANKLLKVDDLDASEHAAAPRFGHERQRMLIAPLIRAERPFGALYLADPAGGAPFTGANVNLLSAVAAQAAAAIENALHHQAAAAKEQLDRHYLQF